MSRLQHQLLGVAKVVVSGRNHPVARLEAVGNFVLLWVLSADGERHAHGTRLVLVQLVDPLPTRSLVEIAAGNDEGVFGLTQLDLYAETLAHTDVVGHIGGEDEVDVEHAVLHFGHYLGDLQRIALALVEDGCG